MKLSFVLKLLVTVSILFIVVYYFDINILNSFTKIENYNFFILAMLVSLVLNPIISINRWKYFLSVQGIKERFLTLLEINYVAIFLGILLPSSSGFDSIKIYEIEKKHKQKLGQGGASVIAERLIGFYLLSLLGLVGATYSLTKNTPYVVFFMALFFHLFIIFIFLVIKNKAVFSLIQKWLGNFERFKKLGNYLSSLYSSLHEFPFLSNLKYTIPLIFLQQFASVVSTMLLFQAFNINLPFHVHFAFVPTILILTIIPISISGFGIREGFFVYFYSLIGVSNHISLQVSLLFYSLTLLVPAAIGLILFLIRKI